jgi:hypothetical protein
MALQAFIDDSGRGQHPAFVLAGWIASPEQWAEFSDEWKRVLHQSPRIEFFKMGQAWWRKGQLCRAPEMPPFAKAAALAAVAIALSDSPSGAACRHFSIWNFPWPQSCPPKQIGQFINEPSPPTPIPASPPTQDQEPQRQQAIERLKKQLNSQRQH